MIKAKSIALVATGFIAGSVVTGYKVVRTLMSLYNESNSNQSEFVDCESLDDAYDVLYDINKILARWGYFTRADILNAIGVLKYDYTNHTWGWYSADGIRIQRTRTGARIILPKSQKIS